MLLTGAKFYRNSSSGSGDKCCTFEALSTEGATVELKSKWKVIKFSNISCFANYQGGTYYHNYSKLQNNCFDSCAHYQGEKNETFFDASQIRVNSWQRTQKYRRKTIYLRRRNILKKKKMLTKIH